MFLNYTFLKCISTNLKRLYHRKYQHGERVAHVQATTIRGLTTPQFLGIVPDRARLHRIVTLTAMELQCVLPEVDTTPAHTATCTIPHQICQCQWWHEILGGMTYMVSDHTMSTHAIHLRIALATCPRSRTVICGHGTHSDLSIKPKR